MMVRGYISKPQSSSYSPSNSDYAEHEKELRSSSDGTENVKMEFVSLERASNQSTQQGQESVVKSNIRPMQQLCIKVPVSQIGQTHQHAYFQSSSSGTTTSTTQCHSIPQQIHHHQQQQQHHLNQNQKHNAIQQTNIEQVRTANSVTVVVIKAMLPDK